MTQLFKITNVEGRTLFVASVTKVMTVATLRTAVTAVEHNLRPVVDPPVLKEGQEPEDALQEFCTQYGFKLEPLPEIV